MKALISFLKAVGAEFWSVVDSLVGIVNSLSFETMLEHKSLTGRQCGPRESDLLVYYVKYSTRKKNIGLDNGGDSSSS